MMGPDRKIENKLAEHLVLDNEQTRHILNGKLALLNEAALAALAVLATLATPSGELAALNRAELAELAALNEIGKGIQMLKIKICVKN